MNKISLITILFVFILSYNYAQTKVVNGRVYAFKNLSLKNIKVASKKSKAVVSTDSLGQFSIVCEKKDRLVFSGQGFQTIVKPIKNKDYIDIKLVFRGGAKNEEIAIGYGIVSEDQLTNAVSHFSAYNNDFGNYTDIFDLIQGKFAGVEVVNNGGSKHILIRGISTTSGNNYAIYVVDGTPVSDISYIHPTTVKDIDVLKDGASIYGANGGTGAVLITTVGN